MVDTRPVWIEAEVREWLAMKIEQGSGPDRTLCRLLAEKYDAAPTDPAETVRQQIAAGPAIAVPEPEQDAWLAIAVLRALGMPS